MTYEQYLQTEHWKSKRAEKLAKNPDCQICESKNGIHVHHKYYKDKLGNSLLFREPITALITLCSSCHRLIHHYFGIHVEKINKKILRVRRLLALGAIKKKAFWVVSQENQLFISIVHK